MVEEGPALGVEKEVLQGEEENPGADLEGAEAEIREAGRNLEEPRADLSLEEGAGRNLDEAEVDLGTGTKILFLLHLHN